MHWIQPPGWLFLLFWRHLDPNLHRLQPLPGLPSLGLLRILQWWTPPFSSRLIRLFIAVSRQRSCLAFFPFMFNEEKDFSQRESHLTLAAGQQVMVSVQVGGQGLGQVWLRSEGGQTLTGQMARQRWVVGALNLRCPTRKMRKEMLNDSNSFANMSIFPQKRGKLVSV